MNGNIGWMTSCMIALVCAQSTYLYGDGGQLPNCDCYFTTDCPEGKICDHGVHHRTRDICHFRTPKPAGPGTGCTQDTEEKAWGPCDGLCVDKEKGSSCGNVDPSEMKLAIDLWTQAVVTVGAKGGGRIDPELAAQARAAITQTLCSDRMPRDVGSILTSLGGYDLFLHPDEEHDFEDHDVADLSGHPALVCGLWLISDALIAEINNPGSAAAIVAAIPVECSPDALAFAVPCPNVPDVIECLIIRVEDTADYLTTPLAVAAIPTVSEWGLIILFLLLLTTGTIVIRRSMAQTQMAMA